ncbi:MAG TPA: hypothetical protein VIN34_05770 [Candidatus Limnocylindria bacterium]|jgi:hypothetical protein
MHDLDPEEQAIHRILGAVRPEPLPVGFRDAVMRRVASGRGVTWEWVAAAALAVPSLGYLCWAILVHGADLAAGAERVLAAAQGLEDASGASFFVDGLLVMAVALVGLGSLIAAQAMLRGTNHRALGR